MRACEAYIDLIMRSIDGETTAQEEVALHAHLFRCEACRTLYRTYIEIDQVIQNTEEAPPAHLTAAVMHTIRNEKAQAQPKHWIQRYRFTMIAAVAAIVILVSATVGGKHMKLSEGIVADNTEAEAAVAVPETAAEFRCGDVAQGDDGVEEAVTEGALPEAPALAEEVPENGTLQSAGGTQSAEQVDASVNETEETGESAFFPIEYLEMMEQAGYYGDALLIADVDVSALQNMFPEANEVLLENGESAFEVSKEDVRILIEEKAFTVVAEYQSDTENEVYWIILEG